MLFTWDTKNLCIVFRQWHVRGTASLIFSLLAIVIIAMGYEGLRSLSAKYERAVNQRIESLPRESTPPPWLHVIQHKDLSLATV
jgi:solute carrier family 31 (copper transporter), member 1